MRTLVIAGTPYEFPDQGNNPAWGDKIADFAEAVSDTLGTLVGPGDILNSTFTLPDNSSGNITGFTFDIATVRSFIAEYSIFRSGSTPKVENGILTGSYDGTSWTLTRESDADVGVDLAISGAGQITFVSSTTGSVGAFKFRARAHSQ